MPNPPGNLSRLERIAKKMNHWGNAPVVYLVGGVLLLWFVISSQWEWITDTSRTMAQAGGVGLSEAISNGTDAIKETFLGLPWWVSALLGIAFLINTPRKWRKWPMRLFLAMMVGLFFAMMVGATLLWGSVIITVMITGTFLRELGTAYDKIRNSGSRREAEPDTE